MWNKLYNHLKYWIPLGIKESNLYWMFHYSFFSSFISIMNDQDSIVIKYIVGSLCTICRLELFYITTSKLDKMVTIGCGRSLNAFANMKSLWGRVISTPSCSDNLLWGRLGVQVLVNVQRAFEWGGYAPPVLCGRRFQRYPQLCLLCINVNIQNVFYFTIILYLWRRGRKVCNGTVILL